jgi:predicted permease
MLDLGVKINLSLQAVAQLLVVIGAGTWLAKRHGFGKKSIAAVASVNWHACIPALLFSSIVAAIDAQRLATLWPLLVFSLLHVVIGAGVSLGLGLVTRLPRDLLFFTVMAACVPNSGNLPWLVLPIIVRQLPLQGTADSNVVYTTGEQRLGTPIRTIHHVTTACLSVFCHPTRSWGTVTCPPEQL